MKNVIFLLICIILNKGLIAQRTTPKTDSLIVFGKIKTKLVFRLSELDTFPKTSIKDQIIYNQNGEIKDTLVGIKGIPLKQLLGAIQFNCEKPRNLNEFYLVFKAADGYKVVFSWNEIYNTEIGNNFFIITELAGVNNIGLNNRILFISAADLKAGRRYIKGLATIEVRQVE